MGKTCAKDAFAQELAESVTVSWIFNVNNAQKIHNQNQIKRAVEHQQMQRDTLKETLDEMTNDYSAFPV